MQYIICFSIDSENQYETWESFDNFLFEISELDHLVSTKEANHHVLSKYYPKKKEEYFLRIRMYIVNIFTKQSMAEGGGQRRGHAPLDFSRSSSSPFILLTKL